VSRQVEFGYYAGTVRLRSVKLQGQLISAPSHFLRHLPRRVYICAVQEAERAVQQVMFDK